MGLKWPQWPDCVRYGQTKEDVTRLYNEVEPACHAYLSTCLPTHTTYLLPTLTYLPLLHIIKCCRSCTSTGTRTGARAT